MQVSSTAAILGVLVLVSTALAEFKVPSPDTTEHSGAKEAPASDPRTYPDEAGFQARAAVIIDGVASNDLGTWRRGYFTGGDPGKYLPNAAMARLLKNPQDPDALRLMNDDRTPKEHYHFAAVNWARFYPLFGSVLTPETKKSVAANAGRYSDYLQPKGTENHRTMSMTAGNVLPLYIEGDRIANTPKDAALKRAKENLRRYVRGLYHGGAGEWDSSTYYMFTINGMLAIYDFHTDPECRLLAKAALDWFASTYALKYTDAVYAGPNQRGFAGGHAESIADQTGWLWWGSPVKLDATQTKRFLYAMHPLTSGYRPNAVITNIARKNLPSLPAEHRNSKPDYWWGHDKPAPTPGVYHETAYSSKHYTLASLWDGSGGQITRFQLVARTPAGPVVFTAGSPAHFDHTMTRTGNLSYRDGNGNYDQSAQIGPTYLHVADIPDGETWAYVFFSLPSGVEPKTVGDWTFLQAGETFLAIRPLGGKLVVGQTDLTDKQKEENEKLVAAGKEPKHKTDPVLRVDGRRVGFLLETGDTDRYNSFDEFVRTVTGQSRVEADRFADDLAFSYTSPSGKRIDFAFARDGRFANVKLDGKTISKDDFPIFGGPYVQQVPGVLSVNDGRDGFVIDFTGELPVYKPAKP